MEYKPFLIQKLKSGSLVKDSRDWGIWIKHVPFQLYPKVKEIAKRSWPEENGDDEYLPDAPKFEAYTTSLDFVYLGAHGEGNQQIRSFLNYLSRDGEFSFYDTYSQIGRTRVRFESFSEKAFRRREKNKDVIEFSVSLKVNDPITDIVLRL